MCFISLSLAKTCKVVKYLGTLLSLHISSVFSRTLALAVLGLLLYNFSSDDYEKLLALNIFHPKIYHKQTRN